jgi:uncharacterized BrkB/YihY/UPF0761 family membrane protein
MQEKEKLDGIMQDFCKNEFSQPVPDEFKLKMMIRIREEENSRQRNFFDDYLWVLIMSVIVAALAAIYIFVPSIMHVNANERQLVSSIKTNWNFWVQIVGFAFGVLFIYISQSVSIRSVKLNA